MADMAVDLALALALAVDLAVALAAEMLVRMAAAANIVVVVFGIVAATGNTRTPQIDANHPRGNETA
jgi:hypothetical protein